MADLPLISLLLLSLPFGALLIWLLPERYARVVALVTALLDLLVAMLVVAQFDSRTGGFQMLEQAPWIPTLDVYYKVGVDGISVLFLPLTVLLFLAVLLASWNQVRLMPRLFFSLLLLLESATLGVFCALDTMLFFLFWELSLLPLYFLVSHWGVGPNRRFAAVKYSLFMLAGGIPLLFGFLVLALGHAGSEGVPLFDLVRLLELGTPAHLQTLVFFLLLAGFAVKAPLVPFHTWLPVVAMEGPVAVVALLAGLKLGLFGLIRFVVPLAPEAAQSYHWLLAGLGVLGILYGALGALAQSNLRRMLAFSSVSHVGLVVLGVSSFSLQGIQGALFQLLNFIVISGGLFLLSGFLHQRIGSTEAVNLGGGAQGMPLLSAFFFLFALASLGVPGTSGFPAEFLLLFSALQ
ncbi:MAG TPA: NADH-quinone oxidoreductase subunit M, partial [Chromatiaceae bacterium]|nr:NADH-quinone oxidoreductase subunit M [Chromatiaceae bacterium]